MPRDAQPRIPKHLTAKALRCAEVEARILRLLAIEPMGDLDLAPYIGIGRTAVARHTIRMHKARTIHVASFRMPTIGGNARALYAPGDKPDFVRILKESRKKTPQGVTEQRKADILALLAVAHLASDVAYKIDLSVKGTLRYILILRREGKVRIVGWAKCPKSKQWVPMYGLGDAPDEPLPPPSSSRTRGSDAIATERSRKTVEETIATARKAPHSIFAALGI